MVPGLLTAVTFLIVVLLLLQSTGSRHLGFISCSTRAQWLQHVVSVAPQNMGSSIAGIEPMSLATAGGSLSIAPPGEVPAAYFLSVFLFYLPFFFFFF